jgi:hypothetical protein
VGRGERFLLLSVERQGQRVAAGEVMGAPATGSVVEPEPSDPPPHAVSAAAHSRANKGLALLAGGASSAAKEVWTIGFMADLQKKSARTHANGSGEMVRGENPASH